MAGENDDTGKTGEGDEDLKTQIAELNDRLKKADERATKAEHTARTATATAAGATERVQQSELQTVTTAIESLKTEGTSLETQYETAAAEGNHRLMASLARQMSRNESQLTTLEAGKQHLENEAEAAKNRPAAPLRPEPGESPAEFLAKQLESRWPRAAQWLRRNPEYGSGVLYKKMEAAHNLWIADNPGTEETDEYFAAIEGTLKFANGKPPGRAAAAAAGNGHDAGAGTVDVPLSSAAGGRERDSSGAPPPAAPPRGGSTGKTARLTPQQQEAARMSGLTDQEYADNQVELKKAGRLN